MYDVSKDSPGPWSRDLGYMTPAITSPWRLNCQELTTLWVARLDNSAELKVTDPKEQQRDVEEEEAEGKERWDGVDCRGRQTGCCWR